MLREHGVFISGESIYRGPILISGGGMAALRIPDGVSSRYLGQPYGYEPEIKFAKHPVGGIATGTARRGGRVEGFILQPGESTTVLQRKFLGVKFGGVSIEHLK